MELMREETSVVKTFGFVGVSGLTRRTHFCEECMKKIVAIVAVVILSGCTVNVVDKRLTREEVAVAFQQRDAALEGIAKAVKELKDAHKAKK